MQFNSYNFILYFFPLLCLVYYCVFRRNKKWGANSVLLIMSLVFCAFAGKECLSILIISIIVNYVFYKGILYFANLRKENVKVVVLFLGIAVNLVILLYFKYYNFFVDISNYVFDTGLSIREIVQPMGISFVTFQQIAFLVDSYRGEIENCNIGEYALFVSYFPHISSGPIILHRDLLPHLRKENVIEWRNIAEGIYMFVIGLGKKVLIADVFAQSVNWGYANIDMLNSTSAIFVSIAYTIQIYFDFSGYSDMAIGISRILQLDLPTNFNSPYKAKTILEFWDRWHMTLTRFFTKYLYIPLGGSRKGIIRTYINTLIVFMFSGLWHGASITFVLWGVLHGCFMIFTKHFINIFEKIPSFINHCITMTFINITWILFRAGSFSDFRKMTLVMLEGKWGALNDNLCEPFVPAIVNLLDFKMFPTCVWTLGALVISCVIIFKCKNVQEKVENMQYSFRMCMGVCVIAVLCVLSFSGVSSFIYSNF